MPVPDGGGEIKHVDTQDAVDGLIIEHQVLHATDLLPCHRVRKAHLYGVLTGTSDHLK